MKIRKAEKEDLGEIDKIYVEGSIDEGKLQFPKVSEKEMLKELEKYSKIRRQGFRRELKNKKHYWIVVKINKGIVGFGQARIKNKYVGMVEKIYVYRKFRRKGIGKKILKKLILWLKNKKVKHIEAGIYWNNKPSIKLQKRLGFKPISLRMRLK